MISDEEVDQLAEKLRAAGSGRKEPEYFRDMAREILEAAESLR